MNTLPTNWYIEVTRENQAELNRWRKKVATEYRDHYLIAGRNTLLSEHPDDGSYYYSNTAQELRNDEDYNDYQEITLEQFRQITNSNQKPMSKPEVKTIQIPHSLLIEYYNAATTPQKEYMSKHFKLDGTTTDETIRGLYELACREWKPKIKANHPECFTEDSKYFDFSSRPTVRGIVSDYVADSLGMRHDFIQIRNNESNPETHYRSFYLTSQYNWELKQDGSNDGRPVMVLIPTKNKAG
jgi:hypothetical protein